MEQLHTRADRDQVGGNVEGVGHEEGRKEHGEERSTGPAKALGSQFAETGTGGQGRAVADLLDGGHERQRQ